MMSKTSIEWTQETWNPIVGCSIVSPGCTNCYAMKMAARIEKMREAARPDGTWHGPMTHYAGTTKKVNGNAVWTGKLAQAPDSALLAPLRRKKPTTYFVNSMGDLFHEDCPDTWIHRVFAVMALSPQHTFQVLTKRAARMRDYCTTVKPHRGDIAHAGVMLGVWDDADHVHANILAAFDSGPLPNVWLGVSTERQREADERIPLLLQTPAAVRFISAEPLLGAVDLRPYLSDKDGCESCDDGAGMSAPHCHRQDIPREQQCPNNYAVFEHDEGPLDEDGAPAWIKPRRIVLDWVIAGGESGPGARPMHPDWARGLRDQCQRAGVNFFFKQWGNWRAEIDRDNDDPDWRQPYPKYKEPHFQILNLAGGRGFHGERVHIMRSCSKKSAGRLLDGVEHNAMPEARR